jgi:4-amino-4-deoxy-L-arabinose transferase-like glycosyltransferase
MPKIPFWVFILIAIVYFTAIRVDTMDIDASQYASMSRELLDSHNWLFLYDRGIEYLDKPPFLMWISALSMKIFGIGNFGYKLPSILFALWALYATYRLTRLLYGEATARMAALVLATCQGLFLMTNDVRTDTILMSCVITSIWLIKEWDVTQKYKYLFAGFFFVGLGMMTKGPIALLVPGFCFVSDWALKREWKKFFNPAYLLGIVIIAIVLLPMSIGLYQQFDMHPEKTVNGLTHVSGLRFFYWSQSFGRITGESPWNNGAGITFLLENMLWSYLPWILVLLPAIVINVITLVRQKLRLTPQQEWISTGGFLLAYLSLGSSAYQLPHYIFVAFPLASIIVASSMAAFLEGGKNKTLYKILQPVLMIVSAILAVVVLGIVAYIFPSGPVAIGLWVVGIGVLCYMFFVRKVAGRLLLVPAAVMIFANVFVTNFMYYNLLQYQVGSQMGKYIHDTKVPVDQLMVYKMRDPLNSLDFYAQHLLFGSDTIVNITPERKYILTMDEGYAELQQHGFAPSIIKQGELFKVSELTPEFLNPATRSKAVKKYYFVKVR